MVTEFVLRGVVGAKGLKVWAETYAGRISSLKIQDIKSERYLARYEHHEWLYNKLPLYHIETIIHHVLDSMF